MSEDRRPLRWGVASLVEQPMPELAERARDYEALGYSDVWVPDERLPRFDAFALHGTPAQVRQRLGVIRDCGVDHVSLVLFPPAGGTTATLARRIAQEVVSPLTPGGTAAA